MDWKKIKLIDEKGRLFSKINLLDFLVILFILCILPGFYFGYKIVTKEYETREPTVKLNKAEYEQRQAECEKLKNQRNALLREHKRLRKYFE